MIPQLLHDILMAVNGGIMILKALYAFPCLSPLLLNYWLTQIYELSLIELISAAVAGPGTYISAFLIYLFWTRPR